METVILFDRPIWVLDIDEETGGRKVVELWGYKLPSGVYQYKSDTTYYLNYLVGASKWMQEGNKICPDKTTWISKTGEVFYDLELEEYWEKARREMPIDYCLYRTTLKLDEETPGLIEGRFLYSKELYNKIKETGIETI